ncbi:MAG: hypothetical protein DRJ42_21295 [Deltaproteobacteria bacterium]|nr:MAG: hypothetical protein DRJ42_21295 [Deltaproteobacteria bacterium]
MDAVRKEGVKTLGTGLGVVALSGALMAALLWFESDSITGMGFSFIGWTMAGYGVGGLLFGEKFVYLKYLIAAVVGFVGLGLTWGAVEVLFDVTLQS